MRKLITLLFPLRYLLADKGMAAFPVAASLLVSFLSAVSILGNPAETYANGIMYTFQAVSYFWVYPVLTFLYVPVFYELKLTSCYEV